MLYTFPTLNTGSVNNEKKHQFDFLTGPSETHSAFLSNIVADLCNL